MLYNVKYFSDKGYRNRFVNASSPEEAQQFVLARIKTLHVAEQSYLVERLQKPFDESSIKFDMIQNVDNKTSSRKQTLYEYN